MIRNPPFRFFYSFLRDLIIFIISFIFSFEIVNVVVPDPKSFFWIAASITDAAAVYPNGNRELLANGLSIFFIIGKISFNNDSLWFSYLNNWVFDNFILGKE